MEGLYQGLIFCLQNSLAASTLSTYRSGARQYINFCNFHRFTPFPVAEIVVCLFAVASAQRNLSYRTIKVYLFGIQFHSLLHGHNVKISSMHYLYYILRGIRRIQGNSLIRPKRRPITVPHLRIMLTFLQSCQFSEMDKLMWHCVIVLAFFGFLRVSEFTCSSNSFTSEVHLAPQDISFNHNFSIMYVKIKASKTDPFRSGCTIRLAAIPHDALCPVHSMRRYLAVRGLQVGPLFIFHDGAFLTRKFLVAFLHISLPGVPNINTHSFRIGGASAALSAGASDALIRIMGRWSSDCYNRYIRISDRQVTKFQFDLASSYPSRVWDFD